MTLVKSKVSTPLNPFHPSGSVVLTIVLPLTSHYSSSVGPLDPLWHLTEQQSDQQDVWHAPAPASTPATATTTATATAAASTPATLYLDPVPAYYCYQSTVLSSLVCCTVEHKMKLNEWWHFTDDEYKVYWKSYVPAILVSADNRNVFISV